MRLWNPPFCALLLVSLACACSSGNGLVVVVTVDPPASGEEPVELRATLQIDGKATRPIDPITVKPGTPTRFSLKLDQGLRGKVDLTVEGKPNYAYVTHKGTSTIQISEDRRYETIVELKYQTQCTDTGWCWEHARPRGNALLDVWGTGPNDIWAVGEGGTILHYDGWAFSSVPIKDDKQGIEPVINPRFTAVHGTSETDVWAISNIRAGQGQRYALYKYDFTIRKMQIVDRAQEGDNFPAFRSLWVGKDLIWIDGIPKSKQSPIGAAEQVPQTMPSLSTGRAEIYRIVSSNPQGPDDLWAVGSIYDTTNTYHNTPAIWHWQSSAWVPESVDPAVKNTNMPLYHIWVSQSGDMWASSLDGNFNLHKTPSGQMWTRDAHPNQNLKGIIYGATQDGAVLAITGNANEDQLPTPSRSSKNIFSRSIPIIEKQLTDGLSILRAFIVPGQNPPVMYLVGEGGLIQRYDVQENQVTALILGTSASSAHINDIFGFTDKEIWAVGNQGTILHYNGAGWAEETPKITQSNLRAVWGVAADDVWAVGDNSTILHRTSLAGPFVAVTSPVSGVPLNGVWGTSAQNVFIAGNSGTLLHWDGTAWVTANNTGFSGHIQGIWANDQANIFIAGFLGTTGYVYKGNGTSWTDISPRGATEIYRQINKIRGSSSTNVVITEGNENGQNTWVYNGSAWQAIPKSTRFGIATFSAQATYLAGYQDGLVSTGTNSANRSIGGSNFLNALWGTKPENIWAVGESGTILHYQGLSPP